MPETEGYFEETTEQEAIGLPSETDILEQAEPEYRPITAVAPKKKEKGFWGKLFSGEGVIHKTFGELPVEKPERKRRVRRVEEEAEPVVDQARIESLHVTRSEFETKYELLSHPDVFVEKVLVATVQGEVDLARVAYDVPLSMVGTEAWKKNVTDAANAIPAGIRGAVNQVMTEVTTMAKDSPQLAKLGDPKELEADVRGWTLIDRQVNRMLGSTVLETVKGIRDDYSELDLINKKKNEKSRVEIPPQYYQALRERLPENLYNMFEAARNEVYGYSDENGTSIRGLMDREILWGNDIDGVESVPKVFDTVVRMLTGGKGPDENEMPALNQKLGGDKGYFNGAEMRKMNTNYDSILDGRTKGEQVPRINAERMSIGWMLEILQRMKDEDTTVPERGDLVAWLNAADRRLVGELKTIEEEIKRRQPQQVQRPGQQQGRQQAQGQQQGRPQAVQGQQPGKYAQIQQERARGGAQPSFENRPLTQEEIDNQNRALLNRRG